MASHTPDTSASSYDAQGWSASLYNKSAAFPGEKIIDLGCGSGEVTLVIEKIVKQAPGGLVVAVDYSESMIAKSKEAGLAHAYVSDIQNLDIPMAEFNNNDPAFKFDAAFSTATFHWCKRDPAGVLESVKKILKPGGRLVVEMGGAMNCIGLRSALHRALKSRGYDPTSLDPWFFPSVEEYTKACYSDTSAHARANTQPFSFLTAASFEPLQVVHTARITPLADGIRGWLEVFARKSILKECPDNEATEIIDEVEETLSVDCKDVWGNWSMVYTRLRFSAVLKI
ncbi:Methyltranfer-dom domain-containing protein [Mycena sanguinolenta]|uniref:Methyltranfer-dom domain-containing protein n=1 Tax=Mycena sanguinolenta TaxID=230812 RepID=A0A8H6YAX6_9AGAR|nr:Methyltranfer-dom domain-containing protein [Mycena sanguinolenta]